MRGMLFIAVVMIVFLLVDFSIRLLYNVAVMSKFLQIAKDIVRQNCRALLVPIPSIRVVEPSAFPSPTMESAASRDGKRLAVNRVFAERPIELPRVWLVLSHECRHIWQAVYADVFNGYRQSSELSVHDYNAQPAEVDAWAWAVLVVSNRFGVRPTLENTFGVELWSAIEARAAQIADSGLF